MTDRVEHINRLLDEVHAFIDYPPRGTDSEAMHALGDRLQRMSDHAYMAGRATEQRHAA